MTGAVIIHGTMPGQLCSKSNSRRIVFNGGRPRVIKSSESIVYANSFARLFRRQQPFLGPVMFEVEAFYKDRLRDLDVALLQDCLQLAGIIKNDRQVEEVHAYRRIDAANPHTLFTVREL